MSEGEREREKHTNKPMTERIINKLEMGRCYIFFLINGYKKDEQLPGIDHSVLKYEHAYARQRSTRFIIS